MKAVINITGNELLVDQLYDWLGNALEQAAEDQEEFEHESGGFAVIDKVTFVNGAIHVTLAEPEEDEE